MYRGEGGVSFIYEGRADFQPSIHDCKEGVFPTLKDEGDAPPCYAGVPQLHYDAGGESASL